MNERRARITSPRHLLALLLCVLMAVGMLPMSAFAGDGLRAAAGDVSMEPEQPSIAGFEQPAITGDAGTNAASETPPALSEDPLSDLAEPGLAGEDGDGQAVGEGVGEGEGTEGTEGAQNAALALRAEALGVEALGIEGDLALSPMGLLGGTAPKLDGDWAYLTKFEILDDPTTPGVVEGIQDGSGPFDTDTDPNSWTYKDRQGNDENGQNGKVRSFDTVTYKLNYATATSGEYDFVKEGWLNYEMVLPYAASRAVWQTDSMAWVGTKVADQAALDSIDEQTSGFFLSTETRQGVSCQVLRGKFWIAPNDTNPYAIPGEGTLSAVAQVLAMEEGDMLEPSFSGWMENNVTYQTTCGTHKRAEIKTFTAPATTVTAEVRLDIEMSGNTMDGISSYNFNTGDPDAPNYGKGTVTGKNEVYGVGVYLWNGDVNKGRKGLMAPQSGDTLTFDLTLGSAVIPTGGAEVTLSNTANYKPLLWALGSNDDAMDWRGRTTLIGQEALYSLVANTPYGSYTVGDTACPNGGVWTYTIDSTNPNKVHVTVSGLQIDLTNFPHWQMAHGYSYDTSGAIPISSGQLQLVQPIEIGGTHMMEDPSITGSAMGSGTVWNSVTDDNMRYQYVSKADGNTYVLDNNKQTNLTDDIVSLNFYSEKGSGTYDSHVLWSNAPIYGLAEWIYNVGSPMGDTTGGKYYLELGGDPVVRNQSIGSWFGFYHQNDVAGDGGTIVAGNSLLKFDSNAVTPTGSTVLQVTGYAMTALYATKADGSAWASDDEMETTSMTALKYYASLSDIPNGHTCVAILTEYRPVDAAYTGVPESRQHLYSDAGLTVNADAVEGALYQCTVENYAWSKDAYEALGKSIPSLLSTSTLPAADWHWQPDYNKGAVDPDNGHLVGDTSGFRWGDVMQIVCGRSRITKEVAQQENEVNKTTFYMDSDQRFVDYKLNVSTEYVTGAVVPPAGVKTTLTVMDAMPSGIEYVPNSAYYGGTYEQNSKPGRQGTVTGGTQLALIDSWTEGDLTWYKFEIPDVTVGEPLQPIYLTAKIGTRGVEATDVQDAQHIKNYAISQIGKEITVRNENLGLNQGFTEIVISKNGATSRSKLADQTYIENGDAFDWTINIGNNGSTSMPNTLALDTLPYVGDGEGTAFSGTLSLSKWNVDVFSVSNFSAANWKVMYTTDANVRGTVSSQYNAADVRNGVASGPNNVVFADVATVGASIDYATGVVTLPAGFCPTAMVVVGTLPGNQTMRIAAQMKIANGEQGDILVNQLDGYPSPIYVVKRSLEGLTWNDANKDGLRDTGEELMSGVSATLYKLKDASPTFTPNPANEADYEVVKTAGGADAVVETGKQLDIAATTGATTNYTTGAYKFTGLAPGTYCVKFTDGTQERTYFMASPANQGTDPNIDSDASPTYDTSTQVLKKSVITGIDMPAISSATKDINQVSVHNDGGFYNEYYDISVGKTVTGNLGNRSKDFTFTVTLLGFDGTPWAGVSFGYTGDKTGTLTLDAQGKATFTLADGQSITIADVPMHSRYTVAETSYASEGYTTTVDAAKDAAAGTNLLEDKDIGFVNANSAITPTGVFLDAFPPLVALLLAGGAACWLAVRRRRAGREASVDAH